MTRARRVAFFPIVFGLMHLLVDAATISTVDTSKAIFQMPGFQAFWYIVAYDLLAFAVQPFFGLLADKTRFFRAMTIAGVGAVAAGMALRSVEPTVTLLLAGLGNAAFHVGAGAFALHVEPGRATPAGIFVAPGAIGVGLAKYLYKADLVYTWPFLVALGAAFAIAWFYQYPEIRRVEKPKMLNIDLPVVAILLLLFSVLVRSLVGMAGGYQCPKATAIAFGIAFAAFAGKAMGGVLSDRLGWIKVGVGALLISAPLIAFGGANYVVVTIGLFLFQMTMPVTLVAVWSILPGRPGFAFGLASAAYIVGAIPTFFPVVKAQYGPWTFLALILLSAATLYLGLRMLRKEVPMKF